MSLLLKSFDHFANTTEYESHRVAGAVGQRRIDRLAVDLAELSTQVSFARAG